MTNIEKTIKFLQEQFDKSEYLKNNIKDKEYRLNHTYRVASFGKEIAVKEGLDVEGVVIGCLLHDLSYIEEMKTREDRLNHGRRSAELAREFVYSLDIKQNIKEELLYGIAIHVDDTSDFEGNRTVLAETIGECDNIDRFDRYRLYENMFYAKLEEMNTTEKIEFATQKVTRLTQLKEYVFQSKTSNDLWQDRLDYQITYFKDLLSQLQRSDYKKL